MKVNTKPVKLWTKILIGIISMVLFLGFFMSGYGFFVVKGYIFAETQKVVEQNLNTIRSVYNERLDQMRIAFNIVNPDADLSMVKKELGLDYIGVVNAEEQKAGLSEIVLKAFETGKQVVATRIIRKEELQLIKPGLAITIQPTPRARPTQQTLVVDALSMEFARPILRPDGRVEKVLYDGQIINNNFNFVDHIVNMVFEQKMYEGKPYGTVTIFQDDVRIATNVLDQDGNRAIGTRISEEVYKKVVEKGGTWLDRAFVITD